VADVVDFRDCREYASSLSIKASSDVGLYNQSFFLIGGAGGGNNREPCAGQQVCTGSQTAHHFNIGGLDVGILPGRIHICKSTIGSATLLYFHWKKKSQMVAFGGDTICQS
jgi:hypothetical protein